MPVPFGRPRALCSYRRKVHLSSSSPSALVPADASALPLYTSPEDQRRRLYHCPCGRYFILLSLFSCFGNGNTMGPKQRSQSIEVNIRRRISYHCPGDLLFEPTNSVCLPLAVYKWHENAENPRETVCPAFLACGLLCLCPFETFLDVERGEGLSLKCWNSNPCYFVDLLLERPLYRPAAGKYPVLRGATTPPGDSMRSGVTSCIFTLKLAL